MFPKKRKSKIISKNVVKPEGAKIASQYGAYALHAG